VIKYVLTTSSGKKGIENMENNIMKLTYELANGDIGFVLAEHESSDSAHSLQWAEEKTHWLLPEGATLIDISFVDFALIKS
jgi:hypothetical protein